MSAFHRLLDRAGMSPSHEASRVLRTSLTDAEAQDLLVLALLSIPCLRG